MHIVLSSAILTPVELHRAARNLEIHPTVTALDLDIFTTLESTMEGTIRGSGFESYGCTGS